MTITTQTEAEIIQVEKALQAERNTINLTLQEHARERRRISLRIDADLGGKWKLAHQEALASVAATKDKIASHESAIARLVERQQSGDRSVKASDIRNEKDEIDSLKNYLLSDKANLRKAESLWTPFAADNLLAEYVADVLESLLDVPVLIRSNPEDAPEVSPAIVLSQRTTTEDYGQVSPSGKVSVRVVGSPEIDWRSVQLAFDATGSEVEVSPDQITFKHVEFPLPVLASPSPEEVARWADTFALAWKTSVEMIAGAERLRAAGFEYGGATGLRAYTKVVSTNLVCAEGVGTGTARISLATDEDLKIATLRSKVEQLVAMFASENVGKHTAAGEIVDLSIVASEVGDRFQWEAEVGTRYYNRLPPLTVDVTVQIDFRYAAPVAQIVGD